MLQCDDLEALLKPIWVYKPSHDSRGTDFQYVILIQQLSAEILDKHQYRLKMKWLVGQRGSCPSLCAPTLTQGQGHKVHSGSTAAESPNPPHLLAVGKLRNLSCFHPQENVLLSTNRIGARNSWIGISEGFGRILYNNSQCCISIYQ